MVCSIHSLHMLVFWWMSTVWCGLEVVEYLNAVLVFAVMSLRKTVRTVNRLPRFKRREVPQISKSVDPVCSYDRNRIDRSVDRDGRLFYKRINRLL